MEKEEKEKKIIIIDKMPKIEAGLSEPEQGWHPSRETC